MDSRVPLAGPGPPGASAPHNRMILTIYSIATLRLRPSFECSRSHTFLALLWPTTSLSSIATISRGRGMRIPGDQLFDPGNRSPIPQDGPSLFGSAPPVLGGCSAACRMGNGTQMGTQIDCINR